MVGLDTDAGHRAGACKCPLNAGLKDQLPWPHWPWSWEEVYTVRPELDTPFGIHMQMGMLWLGEASHWLSLAKGPIK